MTMPNSDVSPDDGRAGAELDRLFRASWVGFLGLCLLSAVVFAQFPSVHAVVLGAFEQLAEAMVNVSIVCR